MKVDKNSSQINSLMSIEDKPPKLALVAHSLCETGSSPVSGKPWHIKGAKNSLSVLLSFTGYTAISLSNAPLMR